MPNFNRPAAYLERLRVAERCVKSAAFRPDPKLAMRELCEGVLALIEALIAKEEKTEMPNASDGNAGPGL